MTAPIDRLYGKVGAEELFTDIASVWEAHIEPWVEVDENDKPLDTPDKPSAGIEIEEWTVHDPQHHMPSAASILEWIGETAADNETCEGWFDDFPDGDPVVLELTQQLIDTIARRITYRMAAEHVCTHWITIVDGEPQINGEPMYVPAKYEPPIVTPLSRKDVVRKLTAHDPDFEFGDRP